MMRHADRAAAGLLLLFGVFTIAQAARLPYRSDLAPGPGFVPLWLGVALAVSAAALLAGTFERPTHAASPEWPAGRDLASLAVVTLSAVAAALSVAVIGLPLASGAYMLAVLFFLQPSRRWLNGSLAIATPVVVWFVFVRWLAVPLPLSRLGF
jgi:putative tricarboxylic transport membrane protein